MKAKPVSKKQDSESVQKLLSRIRPHFCASGSILLPLAQKWGLVGLVLSGTFVALALPGLAASSASAASLSLSLPSTLTLSIMPNGTFQSQKSEAITITSDAYGGYRFTIKSSDNTNALVNGSNRITSITGPLEGAAFPMNTWGYQINKENATSTTFKPGPTSEEEIDNTKSATTPTNYTVTLGAKVDNTLPTGTYGHSFILTITANEVPYNITYNTGDGGSAVSPTTGTGAEGAEIELAKDTPIRSGYEFMGWCSIKTSDENCTGKQYTAGGTYKLANNANNVTLYAMWKQALRDLGNMQDFKCSMLSAVGDTGIATDSRDGNQYHVRKLADDKCWMIDNLRLGDEKMPSNRQISSANSDMNSGTYTLPTSSKTGFTSSNYNGDWVFIADGSKTDYKIEYGGYYSWHLATAGTGTKSLTSSDATSSICPKGWKLPRSADFQALYEQYNSSKKMRAEDGPNFLLAGLCRNDSPSLQGTNGYYWSSTANSLDEYVNYMHLDKSTVSTNSVYYKFYGHSVRCVARQ